MSRTLLADTAKFHTRLLRSPVFKGELVESTRFNQGWHNRCDIGDPTSRRGFRTGRTQIRPNMPEDKSRRTVGFRPQGGLARLQTGHEDLARSGSLDAVVAFIERRLGG
jgi:hypothetical protein